MNIDTYHKIHIERTEIYIKPLKKKQKTVSDSFFIVKKDVCGQIFQKKKTNNSRNDKRMAY